MKKLYLLIFICFLMKNYNKNKNKHDAQDIKVFLKKNQYTTYKNINDIVNDKNIDYLLILANKKNKPNSKYRDIATNYDGLYKINEENILSEGAKFLLNHFIQISKKNCNIKKYEYYAFGWSGLVCDKERI